MLRVLIVTGALTILMAAPAQAQSTPAVMPSKAEIAAQEKLDTEKREAVMKKSQSASESRDKIWDAKMKRTMSGVCGGC
ncbi:hypothetical protein [Methylobacterium soli]|uniref:Uncharacterized protein n=1 Tax=Methylobacterium soli TaxID=553447 RepID=A0A6L3SSB6_9HYPH|nr:hypothetical protein [Methylobacterium soli]KAB1071117.1 hypothetical protein F6X53_29310 [Methylobacterium soli]